MRPKARTKDLIAEQVEDELVVYDRASLQAHRLNRSAASVFRHANGDRDVAALAVVLQEQVDPVADENLVWLALDQLSGAGLLEEPMHRTIEEMRMSRRQFVRRVGIVGSLSLLVPVVASIAVPAAAAAQSTCTATCTGTCTTSTCTCTSSTCTCTSSTCTCLPTCGTCILCICLCACISCL
ncbi:MAG: hypothetical protein NVSMB32_01920 [Actinomycetota bacterium]